MYIPASTHPHFAVCPVCTLLIHITRRPENGAIFANTILLEDTEPTIMKGIQKAAPPIRIHRNPSLAASFQYRINHSHGLAGHRQGELLLLE
jgi:hypothetical protein